MKVSYANAASTLAVVMALATGGAYAANTVRSKDIVDGQVKALDLHKNAVTSKTVKDGTLALVDMVGADLSGKVSLSGIANGRCSQVTFSVAGALAGEVPVIVPLAPVQNGITLQAAGVPADGNVLVNVCNLSGTTMTAISDLPVRVVTLG